ncbi:MAG: VOC family protein [Elusimicrobia bacterium]|nr:VOC family protein [Elusimicrobiota bacterium]
MSLPETLGIRHVALFVSDLGRAEAFYRGVLGYQVEWRPDPDNVYLTAGGQDNLALHKGSPGAETRLDHFGIVLRRAADVDAWHAHLEAAGTEIVKPPKTHRDGARSFYAKDPDGNVLQFIHHPPISDRS